MSWSLVVFLLAIVLILIGSFKILSNKSKKSFGKFDLEKFEDEAYSYPTVQQLFARDIISLAQGIEPAVGKFKLQTMEPSTWTYYIKGNKWVISIDLTTAYGTYFRVDNCLRTHHINDDVLNELQISIKHTVMDVHVSDATVYITSIFSNDACRLVFSTMANKLQKDFIEAKKKHRESLATTAKEVLGGKK